MTEDAHEPQGEDLGMEFGLDSVEKLVSHWMLHDGDVAMKIAETPEWKASDKRNGGLTARVTVNGVELPFAVFDAFLMDFVEHEDKKRAEQYADLEAEVERRLKQALQDRADKIIEAMDNLRDTLQDAGEILKPYWED